MTKVKRQHYVPRFYLKKFTYRGLQIFTYDKPGDKSFTSTIDNIASEGYFYDIPQDISTENADPQIVEKSLAEMESTFSATLNGFLKVVEKKKKIRPDHRANMAHFLAMQMLRTKEHRTIQEQLYEKGLNVILKTMTQNEPGEYFVSINKDMFPLQHAMFMFNPEIVNSFVQVLMGHIWFIGVNDSPKPFYTSDNPVVTRGHYQEQFQSHDGIASPGIEIAFPLTPNYILVVCERNAFKAYESRENRVIILNKDNVMYYNSLQVAQSYRQIYSSKDDFALARKMCRDHPEIGQFERPRIQVYIGGQPDTET